MIFFEFLRRARHPRPSQAAGTDADRSLEKQAGTVILKNVAEIRSEYIYLTNSNLQGRDVNATRDVPSPLGPDPEALGAGSSLRPL